MSIIIKDMEIPEGTQTKVVVLLGKTARVNGKDYPVISIPPHGRLGDLDALQKEFEEDANFYDEVHGEPSEFDRQRTEIQYTIERIKNAPTIIEVERENESSKNG